MKRFLSVILLSLAFFATGCSENVPYEDMVNVLEDEYTVNAVVKEKGVEYTVRMMHGDDGEFKIVFAEPDPLWGMGYGFDGEDSYLIYNDMSISLEQSALQTGAGAGVYRWRELLSADGNFTAQKAELDGKECVMLQDGERQIYFTSDKKLYKLVCEDTVIVFNEFVGEKDVALQTENLGGN